MKQPLTILGLDPTQPKRVYTLVSVLSPRAIKGYHKQMAYDWNIDLIYSLPKAMLIRPFASLGDNVTTFMFVALVNANSRKMDETYTPEQVAAFVARHPYSLPNPDIESQDQLMQVYIPTTATIH